MDFGLWMLALGLWALHFGFRILILGIQVKVFAKAQSPWTLGFGSWPLGCGLCVTPDFGFRMLHFTFSTLTFGLWILVFRIQVKVSAKGLWALDLGLCVGFRALESRRWILDFGL